MKYAEWYVAGLEGLLEKGGKQEVVDALVAEVNNPSEKGLEKYATESKMAPCGACGEPYALEEADLKLEKEMLCTSCAKTETTNPS